MHFGHVAFCDIENEPPSKLTVIYLECNITTDQITSDQTASVNAKFDTKVTQPTDSVQSNLNLTSMKDDVSKISANVVNPYHSNLKSLNPYPDQDLQKVLTRSYKIRSFAWSTAAVAGALLEQIAFPQALFEIQATTAPTFQVNTNLVDKLSSFRYFRSKVKVSIRINATKFHYGLIGVTWLPHYYSVNSGINSEFPYKNYDVFQAMNNNAMIMSANDTSTLEFEIPWVTPYQYLDLQRYADDTTNPSWESFIGQVQIWVLNPLRNAQASGTASVRVSVQAQFVDPVVTGMVPFKYISTCPASAFTEDFEPQMDQEQMDKSLQSVVAGVKETKKGAQEFISSMPIVPEMASRAIGFLETMGLDKPLSLEAPKMVNLQLAPDFSSGNGLEVSNCLGLDPQNAISVSSRLFSETPDAMDYLSIARKPSLFSLGSFDSTSAEGALIAIWPVTPSISHLGTPNYFSPTFLAYISSPFTYWKGSIKYMFYFSASQYSTARVRISWMPSEPTSTAPFVFGSGDFLSKVVDITGDTMAEVVIPYVNPYYALEVGHFEDEAGAVLPPVAFNGYLMLHVYNSPITVQTTGTSTIYYSAFISGGEDYTLHKLKSVFQVYNPPYITGAPEVEAAPEPEIPLENQALIMNQEFSKQFEPLIPGVKFGTHHRIIDGDRLDSSLRTVIHRYSNLAQYAIANTTIIRNMYPLDGAGNTPATSDDWRNFQYFSYLYLFWRGSLRYKLIFEDVASSRAGNGLALLMTENQVSGYIPNDDSFNGAVPWHGQYRPSCEFQVPFYHQLAFQPLVPRVLDPDVSAPRFRITRPQCVALSDLYVSAGDDFTYGALSAPPLIRIST